jgi:hypothetical protein
VSQYGETSIFDLVPSAERVPDGARSSGLAVPKRRWSRRRVFGMAAGAFTAAGLGALDLFPGSRPRSASAQVYTTMWNTCRGFIDPVTVCVPSTSYFQSDNCTSTWHRADGQSGTCWAINWISLPTTCDDRNAWRWHGGDATALKRKCSDGLRRTQECGSSEITVFSICRTAFV